MVAKRLTRRLIPPFFAAFPGKAADEYWPGNRYFLVRPCWLRFSSYYRPRFSEEYRLAERPAPSTGWRPRLAALLRKLSAAD